MLKGFFRVVHCTGLLLKFGGPRAFFSQLKRQLYSDDILFGLEINADNEGELLSSKLPYSLAKASEKDIDDLMVKIKTESKGSAHELIKRKWFYECGFHDCYTARISETGDLCSIAWLISVKDTHLMNRNFRARLPRLNKDELLLENCYTFEKYRGNNVMPSAVSEIWESAKSRGYKRLITYVRKDNVASLNAFKKLGFRKFEEIPELKVLFYTKRKYINTFYILSLYYCTLLLE